MFSTEKSSSSLLIIGALIPSSGFFVVNSLYASSGLSSDTLVLYFQSALVVIFGSVFFAPAWGKMPLKTEGEFIPYRFIGRGAVSLARFRGLYLGLLILPLAMAVSIQPLSEYLFLNTNSQNKFTLFIFGVLILNVFFNSLYNRIRIDAIIGYSTFLVALVYVIIKLLFDGANSGPIVLTPLLHGVQLKIIILSFGLLWWFASIVDLPDMRGQLLLTLNDGSKSRRNMILSLIFAFIVQGILLAFPLKQNLNSNCNWVGFVFVAMIILNALQAMFSTNHWTGSIIYAGVIRPMLSHDNYEKVCGLGFMFLGIGITAFWLMLEKTTTELFATIFLFTAGVGPVFIARWLWSKVNAQTVLSAMIGAPLIWILWLLVKQTGMYPFLMQQLEISEAFIDILIPGLLNTAVWLITLVLTNNKEEELHAKQWIQEVGILNEFQSRKNWLLFVGLSILSGLILFGPSFILGK
jgi:hypothetical protein